MKKITKEAYEKIAFKMKGGRKRNIIMVAIQGLKVEEMLFVEKKEWPLKTSLVLRIGSDVRHPRSLLARKKFSVRTLADDSGWVVKRVE